MSAAAAEILPPKEIELRLAPTATHRRLLVVRLVGSSLRVSLYATADTAGAPQLVWAMSDLNRSRLDYDAVAISLWVESAALEVSESEADRIAGILEPFGLRVDRKVPPKTSYEDHAREKRVRETGGFGGPYSAPTGSLEP